MYSPAYGVSLAMNQIEYKKNLVKLHELHANDNVGVPDFIASGFFGTCKCRDKYLTVS